MGLGISKHLVEEERPTQIYYNYLAGAESHSDNKHSTSGASPACNRPTSKCKLSIEEERLEEERLKEEERRLKEEQP